MPVHWRLEEQVVMVRHQTVTGHMDRPKFDGLLQEGDETIEINLILEDTFFSPSAVHDVIPRVRIQNPQGSRQTGCIRSPLSTVNRRLDPFLGFP